MANLEATNKGKNVVELQREYNTSGVAVESVIINGTKVGVLGSLNEADREAALVAIQSAVDGSENLYEALSKISSVASLNDKEIIADEQVDVEGHQYVLCYKDNVAYDLSGEEVVNCKDIESCPVEAKKALLTERLKTYVSNLNALYCEEDEDEDDEEWDG